MYSIYRLNINELDNKFIEGLKHLFHGKDIEIVVSDYDETEYLLSSSVNKEKLLNAIDNVNNRINLVEVNNL